MEEIEVLELDEAPKKKRKLKLWVKLLIPVIFLTVVGLGVLYTYNYFLGPVSTLDKNVQFEIESGSSVYSVGDKLYKEGFIKNVLVYKIYVKLNNINEYKAGIYELNKKDGLKNIVNTLKNNSYKKDGILITFKEGKTIRDVAKVISEKTNITEEEFINKVNDDTYIDTLISKYWFLKDDIKNENIYYSLEGYLFAETYIFNENPTVEHIIETMLNHTDKIFTENKTLFEKSKYSVHDLVTLASIVESEGINSADRQNIAAVFYNRLEKGMSLGSDVTTYYAFKVDLGTRDLTYKELNTYNPYNTRGPKMEGKLPVGAISNFSKSSLFAVLQPAENDYYYFVADKSGKTHFTKTFSEHEKKIAELKKEGNWIEW